MSEDRGQKTENSRQIPENRCQSSSTEFLPSILLGRYPALCFPIYPNPSVL